MTAIMIVAALIIGIVFGAIGYHLYVIGEEDMPRETGIDERC